MAGYDGPPGFQIRAILIEQLNILRVMSRAQLLDEIARLSYWNQLSSFVK
jgi:hypothetical protein